MSKLDPFNIRSFANLESKDKKFKDIDTTRSEIFPLITEEHQFTVTCADRVMSFAGLPVVKPPSINAFSRLEGDYWPRDFTIGTFGVARRVHAVSNGTNFSHGVHFRALGPFPRFHRGKERSGRTTIKSGCACKHCRVCELCLLGVHRLTQTANKSRPAIKSH